MQWCLLAESLTQSIHEKGNHGYGGLWGGENASFHHNMLAHHDSRNARLNGWKRSGLNYVTTIDEERLDYRNNVVYDWGGNSTYGGESAGHYNMVNNYYKYGPATSAKTRLVQMDVDNGTTVITPRHGVYYIAGNYMYGSTAVTNDNTQGIYNKTGAALSECLVSEPYEFEPIPTHTAEKAFEKVLLYAGASYQRDAQDARIAQEAKNGTATYKGSKSGKSGLIDTPSDVGGYCTYNSTPAPTDTDRDGIPNSFEPLYGLDSMSYDSGKKNEEGYTYLEVYINGLVADITEAEYEDVIMGIEEMTLSQNMPVVAMSENQLSVRSTTAMTAISIYAIDGRCMQNIPLEGVCQYLGETDLSNGVYVLRIQMADGKSIQTKVMK